MNKILFWTSEDTPNEFFHLPAFQDKNLLVSITFYKNEWEYQSNIKKVETQMHEVLKGELMDLITVKNTLILYPTQKSFASRRQY